MDSTQLVVESYLNLACFNDDQVHLHAFHSIHEPLPFEWHGDVEPLCLCQWIAKTKKKNFH